MKHRNSTCWSLASPLGLAGAACVVLLAGALDAACAGKPGGGTTPPLDTGTIYYTAAAQSAYGIWSMKPDGSARIFLQPWSSPEATEPSRARHDGSRWFLTLLDLTGTGTEYGIYVVNEDGSIITQVTTPPDLVQPYIPNGSRDRAQLRWGARLDPDYGLIPDSRVSFLGLDQNGQLGIYAADINPEGLGSGFEPVPSSRVREDINLLSPASDYADFDWSPDGNAFVFVVVGTGEQDGIYVTDLTVGSAATRVAPPGCGHPRWSPFRADGTSRIAFFTGNGSLGELDSVNPDGTDLKTVIPPLRNSANPASTRNYFAGNVRWSPHGSYLIYDVLLIPQNGSIQRYIYRATADGGSPACLTKTLTSAFPLGWGAEP